MDKKKIPYAVRVSAALPMVGWSWAVSHMAGPKVKNAKEGT